MTTALRRVCSRCHHAYVARMGHCPRCPTPSRTPSPGRQQRNRIYNTARWKRVRKHVLNRDNHECQLCGATWDLVVDHTGGIQHDDPYNPDHLRTLCLHCSGTIDGGRGASSSKPE